MTRMAAWALALVLAGCGSASENPVLTAARAAIDQIGAPEAPSVAAQRAAVVEAIRGAGVPDPVLMIELPERNAVASMIVGGNNSGVTTWFDATGKSVSTKSGLVVATRGLGHDLMAANVSGARAALGSGHGGYGRTYRYVDGTGAIVVLQFSCTMTREGNGLTEHCTSASQSITNTYSLRNGAAVQSRQWIGPVVGYADLTRLQ